MICILLSLGCPASRPLTDYGLGDGWTGVGDAIVPPLVDGASPPRPDGGSADLGPVPPCRRTLSWSAVNDWALQFINIDLTVLGKSKYDLLVIDAVQARLANTFFTRDQIRALQCSPGGEKLVAAYMNVGQAENYRYYWKQGWAPGNPAWIAKADEDWVGDYWVRYWHQDWKNILYGSPTAYVDRILEAGFDALYLDRIDAYQILAEENKNSVQDMVALVKGIHDYVKITKNRPDFAIIVQNAEEFSEVVGAPWLNMVAGLGKEQAFYWGPKQPVTPEALTWNLRYMDNFRKAGKLVLNVDYVADKAEVDKVYTEAISRGYIPYATNHLLDQLMINAGHEPD